MDAHAGAQAKGEFSTDCRSEEGITIGLLDGIAATCRVLRSRDLTHPAVVAALHDLAQDRDVHGVLGIGRIYLFDERDRLATKRRRTRVEERRLAELRAQIMNLPTANDPEDQRAHDFIREAATLVRQHT
jgi:hypothetical protein